MKTAAYYDQSDVERLTAVIARSPIVVAACFDGAKRLPDGFDQVDIAILDWIAAEGRRAGHTYLRM